MHCLINFFVNCISECNPILFGSLYNELNRLFFSQKKYKALIKVFTVLNIKLFDLVHLNNNFSLWFEFRISYVIAIPRSTWELRSFLTNISTLPINLAIFSLFLYFKFANLKQNSTIYTSLSIVSIWKIVIKAVFNMF